MAKKLVGVVMSTKMNHTVVVKVERIFHHPVYKKTMRTTKNYKAHVEKMMPQLGDTVTIIETRPISKDKHFRLVEKA